MPEKNKFDLSDCKQKQNKTASVSRSGDLSPNPRFLASIWRSEIWPGDRSPSAENPRFSTSKIGDFGEILENLAKLAILKLKK